MCTTPSLPAASSSSLSGPSLWKAVCASASALLMFGVVSAVADTIVPWGDNSNNQTNVPPGLTDIIAISAGGGHNVAIRADRTVVMWGLNSYGQLNVPPGLAGVVAASAGYDHTLALLADSTVVSWGRGFEGQTAVPPGLTGVAAVSANGYRSLVLKADGTVLAWGENGYGQGTVPTGLADVAAISAGPFHSLALRRNGTVAGWGRNDSGQSDPPVGLNNVVAIAAGGEHSLALRSDGTVVAWGRNQYFQNDVAVGLNDVIAITAGFAHSMVLRSGGTVVARGWNDFGQATVPAGLSRVRAISAGFQHSLAQVGQDAPPPLPTIVCPADVSLACTNCNTATNNTGTASATGAGPLQIGYTDVVTGECPKVVTRTWTATDNLLRTVSCVQRISCVTADAPLTITCPRDVDLSCADCNTDPSNTGMAAATGNGPVVITYRDEVSGDCPKVVTRTWTATDALNSAACVQTITCQPPLSVVTVTDSSGCVFDRDPDTSEQDFRLIFTQDPQNWPCYRLTASNPGQFRCNVLQSGTPGQQLTIQLTLPYPFVTQGARPIHAYDSVSVLSGGDRLCLTGENEFFSSARQVTLASYGSVPNASVTVPVTVKVPDSGRVFLTIHLDYGLKKTTGFAKSADGDAVDCATGAELLIPNGAGYVFEVQGSQGGSSTVRNMSVFKRNPGVGGMARRQANADPVGDTLVTLKNAKGAFIASRLTDEDGFFQIPYKHTGKAAAYSVSILTPEGYRQTKSVTLKANGYVHLEFQTP